MLALALAGFVEARMLAARPDRVLLLAALPLVALLLGPRTRARVALAVAELAAIVPLHAFITLLRAARLDGG
ncbi:MAG: hypothetical protein ABIR79_05415 [Candidatus Binatia bacterium]